MAAWSHTPSLHNYARFASDPTFLPVFWNTIALCLAVAAIAVVLAYPVALLLSRMEGRWRYALLMLMLVPLLMSYVIKIYAIRSILGLNGFLNKALMALGPHQRTIRPSGLQPECGSRLLSTLLSISFAILPIFLSLEGIPSQLLAASDDLGGQPVPGFSEHHPAAQPARHRPSAASFVFVLAIGDFLTPQMVGEIPRGSPSDE